MTELQILSEIESVFWARPLSNALLGGILVGIIVLSIYLYRRPWGLPRWLQVCLAVTRVLILALVLATFLEPMAVMTESHTEVKKLPVLVDVSESMSMKDQRKRPDDLLDAAVALGMVSYDEDTIADQAVTQLNSDQRQKIDTSSRLNLATAVINESGQPTFDSLGESMELSFHAFGQSPRLISNGKNLTSDDLTNLKAVESSTSIATSLEAVANSGGVPPAGIILLSD
jgi:hypothetical protein